jgi:biotin operon repressor
MNLKDKIPDFLARIKNWNIKNPCPSKNIQAGLNISEMQVRELVRHLRQEGHPIGSLSLQNEGGKYGYYYANNYKELIPTIEQLEMRVSSQLKTIGKLKKIYSPESAISLFEREAV